MTATVLRADARSLPLDDNSVDLCISSPPYWSLRSYQDAGTHYDGQIGSEDSPHTFLDALLDVMRECVRVTKPSGSIFINLGDKYSTGSGGGSNLTELGKKLGTGGGQKQDSAKVRSAPAAGYPPKTLLMIPERFRIRCLDELGLICRAVIVWSKPNGLPESVTDRVRRSHEDWMHFTLNPRYFSAVDEIREPHSGGSNFGRKDGGTGAWAEKIVANGDRAGVLGSTNPNMFDPRGKLPGSVWVVPTEPLKVPDHLGIDHFAAFPTEWPKRIIQGWSPAGICTECGDGRRPVVHTPKPDGHVPTSKKGVLTSGTVKVGANSTVNKSGSHLVKWRAENPAQLIGYACACPEPTAPTRPAVVLDPFGGTGTTALVAKALGRHGISVDMSADYSRLATWRTNDRDQLAKVLRIEKAEQQPEDQLTLFGSAS